MNEYWQIYRRYFSGRVSVGVSPAAIQELIDALPYSTDAVTRSAEAVLEVGRAHCFDGALLGAMLLERVGHKPQLLDLIANGNDDNHVLAVYCYKGHYGAVAKSNYSGIRFREPVYRTLRELALSYFNNYVTLEGERTLVGYSALFNLQRLCSTDWRSAAPSVDLYDAISDYMDKLRRFRLFPRGFEKVFSVADERLIASEALGLDRKGIFGGS